MIVITLTSHTQIVTTFFAKRSEKAKTGGSQMNEGPHEVRVRPARVDAPLPTVDESFRTCRQ